MVKLRYRKCQKCERKTDQMVGTAGRVCALCLRFVPKQPANRPPSALTLLIRNFRKSEKAEP